MKKKCPDHPKICFPCTQRYCERFDTCPLEAIAARCLLCNFAWVAGLAAVAGRVGLVGLDEARSFKRSAAGATASNPPSAPRPSSLEGGRRDCTLSLVPSKLHTQSGAASSANSKPVPPQQTKTKNENQSAIDQKAGTNKTQKTLPTERATKKC